MFQWHPRLFALAVTMLLVLLALAGGDFVLSGDFVSPLVNWRW